SFVGSPRSTSRDGLSNSNPGAVPSIAEARHRRRHACVSWLGGGLLGDCRGWLRLRPRRLAPKIVPAATCRSRIASIGSGKILAPRQHEEQAEKDRHGRPHRFLHALSPKPVANGEGGKTPRSILSPLHDGSRLDARNHSLEAPAPG